MPDANGNFKGISIPRLPSSMEDDSDLLRDEFERELAESTAVCVCGESWKTREDSPICPACGEVGEV